MGISGWQTDSVEGGPGKIKRGRVIGVVENFHYKSLHSQIEPLVLHIWPRSFDNILMRIRSEDTKNTLAKIQQIWQELSPRFPFVYSFLNEDFDRLYKAEERLGNISALLMKDFAMWVLIANVFAWPLAYMAMSRWLQNFAYRINLGVWIFLLAAVLSSGIALTTVGLKAVKTALADPVDSLRTE
jgi:putative ABC transport system permease protein